MTRAGEVDDYCPECRTCFVDAPETCPECGAECRGAEWKPIELSPYPYLGYLLQDRYLLDQYIGGGASGDVYRAVDRKLERPFALKLVEFNRAGDEALQKEERRRFENEVEALSRLRNPHVIDIYEWFDLEHGTSGLLTEYIDGQTLGEMVDGDRSLSLERALGIMRQVANGLHEAHVEGVVHRDLKPDNVMVEELPASGHFARILDFGLVRMVGDASRTQGFRGTPLYAAPEQCRSDVSMDARADIYALGCVFFHALTGRPPFQGNDPVSVMESHTSESPPSLAELSSEIEIPPRFDALMEEMLEKDPYDRPDSLKGVIEVLDDVVADAESPTADAGRGAGLGSLRESTVATGPPEGMEETSSVGDGRSQSTHTGDLPAEFLQAADLGEVVGAYEEGAVSVRLQKQGGCVVVADGESTVHLIARGTYDYRASFEGARTRVTAVASPLTRGGVFAAEMNGRVLRWEVDRRSEPPDEIVETSARVLAMDVGARETVLLIGTESGEILRYDVRTDAVVDSLELSGAVSQIRTGRQGRRAAVATVRGELYDCRFGDDPVTECVTESLHEPGAAAVGERGIWCAVLDRTGELRVEHLRDDDQSFTVAPVPSDLRSVHFSRNGQLLGVTLSDAMLRIWAFHHEAVWPRGVSED